MPPVPERLLSLDGADGGAVLPVGLALLPEWLDRAQPQAATPADIPPIDFDLQPVPVRVPAWSKRLLLDETPQTLKRRYLEQLLRKNLKDRTR
jgi:hypothetical protein